MPGLAQTDNFMLGTATVMIGAQSELYDLNPTDHSIGLVKNFTITSEPAYTELTQGVKNTIVHSVLTQNPVRCTMEAYEFTAQNIAYALGLSNAASIAANTVETAVNGAIDGGSPSSTIVTVDDATGIVANDYIMIKIDDEDNFIIRQVESVSSNDLTLTDEVPDIPDNAEVIKVSELGVGNKEDQPYYAAKVAGKLANSREIVMLIPKIRIIRGFNIAFTSDDYANMPLEFTVYDLVSTDTFFSNFGGDQAQVFLK